MASWLIKTNKTGSLDLTYKNAQTGQVFECGQIRKDTPKEMVISWITDKGNPNAGDLIRFHDGLTLCIQQGAIA